MMNTAEIIKTKPAELGNVYGFGGDYKEPDWDKTVPEIVKTIQANPDTFANFQKFADELSFTNSMLLLAKAEMNLAAYELKVSNPGSQREKAAFKKQASASAQECEYHNKRIELLEKLYTNFHLAYCSIYKSDMFSCVIGYDRIKIRKEYENCAAIKKLDRLLENDIRLWNRNLILNDIIINNKLPRENNP